MAAPKPRKPTAPGVAKRLELMRFLGLRGVSAAEDIAAAIKVSPARVSQILQELEVLGYVGRTEPNPRSSRKTYLSDRVWR